MVQQLHIRAAQASALLTTNKRYLSHIFIHGVKGSYETMNNWLSILLNNIDEIAALLLKDVRSGDQSRRRKAGVGQDQGSVLVIAILTAFQPGILSHDVSVAHLAASVLTSLGNALSLTKHGTLAWDWFTSEGPESGLLSAIACLKRHLNSKT